MAVEVRESSDVDHTLGGNWVVWSAGLIVGLGLFLVGVGQSPQTGGFLLMIASGLLAGLSYTQVMLRLPVVTHRFTLSLLLTLLVTSVLLVGMLMYGMALPTPSPTTDVRLVPPTG